MALKQLDSKIGYIYILLHCEKNCFNSHCCKLQAVYSLITVENFVTMYTGFDPCNWGNLLLKTTGNAFWSTAFL
jgi:hypothetical protein